MSIWVSILGGTAGFALGGPLGALVGAAAGYTLANVAKKVGGSRDGSEATREIAFTIATVALAAKMAKSDGAVCAREKAAFAALFRFDEAERANVERVFDLATRSTAGFAAYAGQLAAMFEPGAPVLEELLDCLFHIARADGDLRAEEIDFLAAVAKIFGISDSAFESLVEAQRDPAAADPFRVLGIAPDASETEARAIWRRLVHEHHPDRLTGAGMPQEFLALANARLAAINVAWAALRRRKGWT
jgi:DnaJ like chaperone protein